MKRIFNLGTVLFLMGILVSAVYNFFKKDFAITRPRPYPEFILSLNPAMAYISGGLLIAAVAAFAIRRLRILSLASIAGAIFVFATTRHVMLLWRDPINAFKSLWLIGAALLLLTGYRPYEKYFRQVLFANIIVAFVYFQYCGLAHFNYADQVSSMIPAYIPFHSFFTYFTGLALLLASVALLIPGLRKPAALLSAFQIGGWLVLLHLPRAFDAGGDEWIGVAETLSFTGICLLYYCFFDQTEPENHFQQTSTRAVN